MGVGNGIGPVVEQANVYWQVHEIGGCMQMTIWVCLGILVVGWIVVSLINRPRAQKY